MLHTYKTRPLKRDTIAWQQAEMRMIWWMCGVRDRLSCVALRQEIRNRRHSYCNAAKYIKIVWTCLKER